MANIRLKELVEANVDPKLVARSKETGKLVYFKNAQNKDAAMKAGTHEDPKAKKGDEPKGDAKPNDMFGGDYAKDRGGEAPKANLPKKASQLTWEHGDTIADTLNKEAGLDGYAQTDDNSGAIMYNGSNGDMPTYTLYMGSNVDYSKPDEFRVSLEPTYGNDPSKLQGKVDKSFKSAEDAMTYMTALGKKYKKELQMDDSETSSKLTSMLPKDAADGPKINGKDQTTPNRQFDKKKPFDPKEIEQDVKDMLEPEGFTVKHSWSTTDYMLDIYKKDKKGNMIERYTVQKNPKTGLADVWDGVNHQSVIDGETSINGLYDTIGQIPYFRED